MFECLFLTAIAHTQSEWLQHLLYQSRTITHFQATETAALKKSWKYWREIQHFTNSKHCYKILHYILLSSAYYHTTAISSSFMQKITWYPSSFAKMWSMQQNILYAIQCVWVHLSFFPIFFFLYKIGSKMQNNHIVYCCIVNIILYTILCCNHYMMYAVQYAVKSTLVFHFEHSHWLLEY